MFRHVLVSRIYVFIQVALKLEVKEKNLANAEGESGSLSRRVQLLEEEVER